MERHRKNSPEVKVSANGYRLLWSLTKRIFLFSAIILANLIDYFTYIYWKSSIFPFRIFIIKYKYKVREIFCLVSTEKLHKINKLEPYFLNWMWNYVCVIFEILKKGFKKVFHLYDYDWYQKFSWLFVKIFCSCRWRLCFWKL